MAKVSNPGSEVAIRMAWLAAEQISMVVDDVHRAAKKNSNDLRTNLDSLRAVIAEYGEYITSERVKSVDRKPIKFGQHTERSAHEIILSIAQNMCKFADLCDEQNAQHCLPSLLAEGDKE